MSVAVRSRSVLLFVVAVWAPAAVRAACSPTHPVDQCFVPDAFTPNPWFAESFDEVGGAAAAGDFDGDGYLDLAVSAPGENTNGTVRVLYGSVLGISTAGSSEFSQQGLGYVEEGGDEFGVALAAGDFDDDGDDDLAIGVPGDSTQNRGVVHVLPGGPNGLAYAGSGSIVRSSYPLQSDQIGAELGRALAAGDFNGDGIDDLAIGTPGAWDSVAGAEYGEVMVFAGGSVTPVAVGLGPYDRLYESPSRQAGARFGEVVLLADLDGVGGDDLVVGIPFYDVGSVSNVGMVHVLRAPYSTGDVPDEVLRESSFVGTSTTLERFGAALAAGDFDHDGDLDLAIGAPGAAIGGRMYLVYNAAGEIDPAVATWSMLTQKDLGGVDEAGDQLAAAFAVGDFGGDLMTDLLVGAPGEEAGGNPANSGAVYRLRGTVGGLVALDYLTQAHVGGTDAAEDALGSVLLLTELKRDGAAEAVLGVPLRDVAGYTDAGMFYVSDLTDGVHIFSTGHEAGPPAQWSTSN